MQIRIWRGITVSLLSILYPLLAAAQDRPFAFASSPAAWDRDGALVFVEPAYADAVPEGMARDGFASRMGFEARVASRVLLVGDVRFARSEGGSAADSAADYRAEALFDLRPGAGSGFRLAAGTGYHHEASGASVWIGRLVGERVLTSTRFLGDLRLEKAFDSDRDEIDAIVTLGATRQLGRGFSGGVEVVGEDLEGLWEPEEAEGGARLLAGPSFHWIRPDHRLLATVAGGPVFRFRENARSSTAPRSLGNGYAVRASLAVVF